MGEETNGERRKNTGRPADPRIPWDLAETLFVQGELVERDGESILVYPSFGEIAKRCGTSKGNVQFRAKRYNWPQKRLDVQAASGVQGTTGYTRAGSVEPVKGKANPRARGRRDPAEVLADWIDHFAEQVRTKKVRADSFGDFDKAVRLAAFLRGEADSRKVTHTVVSMQVIQQRHERARKVIDAAGEEVTGVLATGSDGGSLEGEEVPDAITATAEKMLPAPVSGWLAAIRRAAASDE